MSQHIPPKSGGCRRCPFRAPSGRCLAPGLKSGRCGDWVWYRRGSKQWRHLYVKPKDPRTSGQLRCRARFGVASRQYSQSLTDEQRAACIAAGAKLRSRPRLGQSGPLTGQQYSIRREMAPTPQPSPLCPPKSRKGLLTKGFSLSTSGQHRSLTGVSPEQHRCDTWRLPGPIFILPPTIDGEPDGGGPRTVPVRSSHRSWPALRGQDRWLC